METYINVNTFNRVGGELGRVVSVHRSLDAACRERDAIQRGVERNNGQGSYLPMQTLEAKRQMRKGDVVYPEDVQGDIVDLRIYSTHR